MLGVTEGLGRDPPAVFRAQTVSAGVKGMIPRTQTLLPPHGCGPPIPVPCRLSRNAEGGYFCKV